MPTPSVKNESAQPAKGPNMLQKQLTSSRVKNLQAVQKQPSSLKHNLPQETMIDFSTKKDPFKAPMLEQQAIKVKPVSGTDTGGDNIPIQSYDVNKFKISGVISGLKENRALILDPNGKAYVVKTGMILGVNKGHITKITNSYLEVSEQFKDDRNLLKNRTVRISLPQKVK
jgi:type IV pilus assembly protein PilP